MLIKATYRNETRRFSITCDKEHDFPSWEQLYNQLYRVFPISSDIYLSTVLFSPDASRDARIMVGREIHNAEQYNNCLAFLPLSQPWKQPMLRFSVYDNTPHKSSARVTSSYASSEIPLSHIPPPPVIYSTTPATPLSCGINPQAMRPYHYDTDTKEDISRLIESFKGDLSRMLNQHFGHGPTTDSPIQHSRPGFSRHSMCLSGTPDCPGSGLQCLGCHLPRCSTCSTMPSNVCTGGRLHLFVPLESNPTEEPFAGPYHPAYIHSASVVTELPTSQATPASPFNTSATANRNDAIHANVRCDQCDCTPVGTRHKCLDCADYDLCDGCMATNGAERHNPFHQFFGIEQPGRVVVHRVLDRDDQDSPAVTPPTQALSTAVVHLASCDLCDSTIQGDRYKCLECPDYDTCSACFAITREQHPHSFVKVSKREDIIHRPSASNVMHYATCDACKRTIYGIRYKCMHPDCPDYDLCSVCEAHPIALHNPRHPLLKMRHPDTYVPLRFRPMEEQRAPRAQSTVQTSPVSSPQTTTPTLPTVSVIPTSPVKPLVVAPSPTLNPVVPGPFANKTPSLSILVDAEKVPGQQGVRERHTTQEVHDKEMDQLRGELAQRTQQERARLAREEQVAQTSSPPPSLSLASPPPSLTSLLVGLDILSASTASTAKLLSQNNDEPRDASVAWTEMDNTTVTSAVLSVPVVASKQTTLRSKLLTQHSELTTFPPGAEFVKSWLMANDGDTPWPSDTKLALVSCEGAEIIRLTETHIGSLAPGGLTEVTTGELKAPELPGLVKMNWQLRDGEHEFFGDLISLEIEVAEPDSDGAMGSSSIIMPGSVATNSTITRSLTTGRTQSTLSLISLPSDILSEYADAADVTPISPSASSVEYVVLSGSESDD